MLESLKSTANRYEVLGITENPFKISPLFRDFHNRKLCENHEKLLVIPQELEKTMQILPIIKDRRALVYGCYGVGKTSLTDLILYLCYHYHNRFCVRTIVTEDNVSRAINEVLLTLCFDIIEEITTRTIKKPGDFVRKYFINQRHGDLLLTSIARLIGPYVEKSQSTSKKKRNPTVKAQVAGLGFAYDIGTEIEIRKEIQSYVEVLSIKAIGKYMSDFHKIVQEMGYKDIVIFIDEADHLGDIEVFLKMLTRAREILFSDGYTFFIAGSPEIARHTESIGSIFDKTIFVSPASFESMKEVLDKRIRAQNHSLSVTKLFTKESLEIIHESTKGVRKQFIRLAENAMDIAATDNSSKIKAHHVLEALNETKDKIAFTLKDNQIKTLKGLANLDFTSSSSKELQKLSGLSRSSLSKILRNLTDLGYVIKEKRGNKVLYAVSSAYLPYFESKKN